MHPGWTTNLGNLIRAFGKREAEQVERMMKHRAVLETPAPPQRDIAAMLNMLNKVFSEHSGRGSDGYITICRAMGLADSREPEIYYANIDRMIAFAEQNDSDAGAGLKTTTPMARAMLKEIGRVLGPRAS